MADQVVNDCPNPTSVRQSKRILARKAPPKTAEKVNFLFDHSPYVMSPLCNVPLYKVPIASDAVTPKKIVAKVNFLFVHSPYVMSPLCNVPLYKLSHFFPCYISGKFSVCPFPLCNVPIRNVPLHKVPHFFPSYMYHIRAKELSSQLRRCPRPPIPLKMWIHLPLL
jgi:hypothetical protein